MARSLSVCSPLLTLPNQLSRRRRGAASDRPPSITFGPDAVAGVERQAEPFSDLGELACHDELMGAVVGGVLCWATSSDHHLTEQETAGHPRRMSHRRGSAPTVTA